MSGTDIFIDTNICIYLLNGDATLAKLLQDQTIYISVTTEMELYAYHHNDESVTTILNDFIKSVYVINIDEDVKANTIAIRKKHKLKLPDSIIAASAVKVNAPLITDDKGFKKVDQLDLIIYQLN
ncbi:type II toxin-antitoxin system VapC family toxin [Mucilaginibacter sp. UR6-1]|uniref:type II toxin-antitoxin system VapC family toxin n=1 Tax=Mucilaginibacter sp. UR6-1 TaxID=1435643 RepID=UPI001E437B04|nr:type II toxin-antitoxin system VapC family toxin [Mucilaginibacter sp. UR6-1]MCC8411146.1 type II toxin-antitoxin system VapC family toxin [Mucilaginibacter sp. UR6-1]